MNRKLRFHILGLPHTITNTEFSACAYTQKVLKFGKMMTDLGHTVIHYGHEDSDLQCTEHVTVITNEDWERTYGTHDYKSSLFKYDLNDEAYQTFFKNAIEEVGKRKQKNDFILPFWGHGGRAICDAHPDLITVEPGIGYASGHWANYKVFESYAIYHAYCGLGAVGTCKQANYDVVIPNYFDKDDFDSTQEKEDYFLFVGRVYDGKGVNIAIQVCEYLGIKLKIAGQLDPQYENYKWPENVEFVGYVNIDERKALMSKAKGSFIASQYVEPFGGVQVENLLSGTPTITTDWGAFTENNVNGLTGYRCRTFDDYLQAATKIINGEISSKDCRDFAEKFTLERVGPVYEKFFNDILNIHENKGWYQTPVKKYEEPVPSVSFSITTCKRLDSFKKTMESFMLRCKDSHLISGWHILDDSSSTEDIESMQRLYPHFNIFSHTSRNLGVSLNKMIEIDTKYNVHIEDDWIFHEDFYIKDMIKFMEADSNIVSTKFLGPDHRVLGSNDIVWKCNFTMKEIPDFQVKVLRDSGIYDALSSTVSEETNMATGWPGFSFGPCVINIELMRYNNLKVNINVESSYQEFEFSAQVRAKTLDTYVYPIKTSHADIYESAFVLNDNMRTWDKINNEIPDKEDKPKTIKNVIKGNDGVLAQHNTDWDYTTMHDEEQPFAERLAHWINNNIIPCESVIDMGCGPGTYVNELNKIGINTKGYDIEDVVLNKPNLEQTSIFDVNNPSDLVICLEVAERIEYDMSNQVIESLYDNVVRGGYIIFSAAHVGQGGVGHINCQPKEFWIDKLEQIGLVRQTVLEENMIHYLMQGPYMGWFLMNGMIFKRDTV